MITIQLAEQLSEEHPYTVDEIMELSMLHDRCTKLGSLSPVLDECESIASILHAANYCQISLHAALGYMMNLWR